MTALGVKADAIRILISILRDICFADANTRNIFRVREDQLTSFGAETTTDEILKGKDLTEKLVVVTGGASGIGEETVRALCSKSARVVMPVRDLKKGEAAASRIRDQVSNADITLMVCDLASIASIRAFASAFLAQYDRLDLLINNAGIMAAPLMRTEDGFEMQFGVCHIGHFLLTTLLMPTLVAASPSRIVNLSSRGHQRAPVDFDDPNFLHRDYDRWGAYGQAKTANILFTVELERRFGSQGVHAYAVHPGIIMTNLGRHLTAEDFAVMEANIKKRAGGTAVQMKTPAQGAATTVFAATSIELEGNGGIYLEDCQVSNINDDPVNAATGVRSYALNADDAKRLWTLTENLINESETVA